VYALRGANDQWIYVGESATIASALLRHLAARNAWVPEGAATKFSFDLCSDKERIARRDALIQELQPTCSYFPARP
jgi:hypothetical protein